ncbi:tryptophan synthase subunit alpha [Desulfitobacterium sp.]|uniref:tryptophan synthase subunit alpha n=1 Tax=Desulfitobacterium sp. TaxID=49981 RepID=UPI002B1EF1A7|nr:tryptophan synthase subunit alpha [Desulfitobacterium sp.]MEA4902612.1 tryptophan synthase subunit alpha [Desulfitobacterium sp.]
MNELNSAQNGMESGGKNIKNRIENKFARLKEENKKAFIPFVMTGDPDLDTTYRVVLEMIERGAAVVELGVPYSDPSAEGPVIMRADDRALQKGVRLKDVMNIAVRVREKDNSTPLVLLLYFNCIFCYGSERFFAACEEAGIDGVIIPDLPYEERDEIAEFAKRHQIIIISMVTPASRERAKKIAAKAKGFLYCVSSLGVTGERAEFSTDFAGFFTELNSYSSVPKAIGFGVSSPEQASYLKDYCDGVIVGSAIVRRIEEEAEKGGDGGKIAKEIGRYTEEMCAALSLPREKQREVKL